MDNLITSWIDVINEVPHYFDWDTGQFINTSKNQILSAIKFEENHLRSKLRPYYGTDLSVGTNRFDTYNLTINKNSDFIINDSYITVTTQFTQVYKIVFQEESDAAETTKVVVYPDKGSPVNGDITGDIDLVNITLGSSIWTGYTFHKGEVIYLVQSHYEVILSDLVSQMTAARILERTANSQLAADGPSAQELRQQSNELIKQITDPYSNLLEISLKAQDLDSEQVEYNIDDYGEDQTDYLDV